MNKALIILLFTLFTSFQLHSQSNEEEDDDEKFKRHAITLSIGHTHVGEGIKDRQKKNIILPSWGLNYDYRIDERWAIGLHNDLIIEEFEVEIKGEDNVLVNVKRSRPLSMAITASYKVNNFLALSAGAGREFAPEEDFTIFRIGLEPYFELPNNFEIIGTFAVDFRVDAFNAFNVALGIAKKF